MARWVGGSGDRRGGRDQGVEPGTRRGMERYTPVMNNGMSIGRQLGVWWVAAVVCSGLVCGQQEPPARPPEGGATGAGEPAAPGGDAKPAGEAQKDQAPAGAGAPADAKPGAAPEENRAVQGSGKGAPDRFFTYYYLRPRPEIFVKMVHDLAAEWQLDAASNRMKLASMFAEVFRQNPDKVEQWVDQFQDLMPKQLKVIWYSLGLSNIEQSRAILRKLAESATDSDKRFVDRLLALSPPDAFTMEVKGEDDLDLLWGTFFAGGDERCVVRVIGLLELADWTQPDVKRRFFGSKVRDSLAGQAWVHSRVLEICRNQHQTQGEVVKKWLGDVIREVEDRLTREASPEPKVFKD